MKLKKQCSLGVSDMRENISTPKVLTINMETGKAYTEYVEENNNKTESFEIMKNNLEQESSTRLLKIIKSENDVCGFNLTRTKWDPYPWVSIVDANSPAEISGLKVGDCILEVNGEGVLGLRITDIAKLVRANSEHVTLLLWNAGCESKSENESLCDGPMPLTLQRLSVIVQSILSIIECPVCLDTIPPPAMQCQNGHILCVNCRIRAEKCPVCRDRYTPKRALIAEQIYAAITNAFNLCRTEDKCRQKLFGTNVQHQQEQHQRQRQHIEQQNSIVNMVTTLKDRKENPKALENDVKSRCSSDAKVNKSSPKAQVDGKERIGLQIPANKFLTKLLFSKACSMDNLSTAATTEKTVQIQSTNSDGLHLSCPATPSMCVVNNSRTNSPLPVMSTALDIPCSSSNQSNNMTNRLVTQNIGECPKISPENEKGNTYYLDDSTSTNLAKNKIMKANGMSNHISLSTNDLLIQQNQRKSKDKHLATAAHDGFIIATKVKPQCTLNSEDLLEVIPAKAQTIESKNCNLLMLDKRSARERCTAITAINSSQCSDLDESLHTATPSDDDTSLPSSSKVAFSTEVKASLHSPFSDFHTLLNISSDSIDDFLSTSTPSTASASVVSSSSSTS